MMFIHSVRRRRSKAGIERLILLLFSLIWLTGYQAFSQLQTPVLIAPQDNEYIATAISARLTWNPVAGAVRYKVRIGIDPLVSKAILYDTLFAGNVRLFDSLAPNTRYYWRIKAIAANGTTSAWSAARSFYTNDTSTMSLGSVQRSSPANGAILKVLNPQLNWKPVPGANFYKVSASLDANGVQTVVFDTTCQTPSYILPSFSNGTTLYWRIKPIYRLGQVYRAGTWTTPRWRFTISTGNTPPPPNTSPTLKLVSPTSGKMINTTTSTLIWSSVTGAINYHVQLANKPNFSAQSMFLQDSMTSSNSKYIQNLNPGTMYYWRARVKTSSGWSQWSPVWNFLCIKTTAFSQPNPIVYVTQVPATGFTAVGEPFANHKPSTFYTPRGGDLMIRYPNGNEKNITRLAGYGEGGSNQITNKAIAVRDPAPSWDGTKVVFSMVVGEQTSFSDNTKYVWQLYEASGLGENETPTVTKISNQPSGYNNLSPTYGTDGRIIFTSDRPRNGQQHLYPQLDEYELTDVNTGLWSLDPTTGDLLLLDHAPSGDYTPSMDSYGRVIFTRWDHLQRDQEADIDNSNGVGTAGTYGTFNYTDESENAQKLFADRTEVFPEPRNSVSGSNVNGHRFNFFFPWQINEDGCEAETMNHIGRHDLAGAYLNTSFTNDPNLKSFVNSYDQNVGFIRQMTLQLREDGANNGVYYFVESEENGQNSAGQVMCITGDPSLDPMDMTVTYITDLATKFSLKETDQPTAQHTGHYRNPLPLSNGSLVVAHSTNNLLDKNIGTFNNPVYRDNFRLKTMMYNGNTWVAGNTITQGSQRTVTNWINGGNVTWQGTLWEWQPIELKARTLPSRRSAKLFTPEALVLQEEGVDSLALRNYLKRKNAALMVTRDITDRNLDDTHQPYYLRVAGTSKQSPNASGKIYDVSHLQILQADQIRGKGLKSSNGTPLAGRRVLAQPAHDPVFSLNPQSNGSPTGGVSIAADGSIAAIVPAHRAMTWQLTDASATPIVRERIWVTFQPGEVRVCGSCHGGNPSAVLPRQAVPANKPLALKNLLQAVKAHVGNLTAPVLQTPADNAVNVTTNPQLTWNDIAEASSFHTQITTDSTFTTGITNMLPLLLPNTSHGLQPNTKYFWRVRAADLSTYGSWSQVRSFTTGSSNKENDFSADSDNGTINDIRNSIVVNPNPTDETIHAEITLNEDSDCIIELNDILGKKTSLQLRREKLKVGVNSVHINSKDIPSGIYELTVHAEAVLITTRIAIVH